MNRLMYNLGRCELFKGITVGQLEEIFARVNHRLAKFLPNEFIHLQGSACEEMMVLLQGEVKTQMQDFSGKVVRIERMYAPAVLASGFLFADNNKLPVDIVALEDSMVLYIDKAGILSLCREYESFLLNLLGDMGDRLSLLAEKVWMLSLNTLKQKLANFLLKKYEENGNPFQLNMSKEELADAFGVARPSLSRVFSEFLFERIVSQTGKNIEVLNVKSLKKATGDSFNL